MWNLDGRGFTSIPVEKGSKYSDFLSRKKKQYYRQLFASNVLAAILACVFGTELRGESLLAAFVNSIKWLSGSMVGTAILSAMAK
mmetsp:Transcript_64633/g.75838  ORF Transcript_64633/g.75838 Transcript_64633/m.75838 type:complete len:85 (-) Transcript_64633:158-412(-)